MCVGGCGLCTYVYGALRSKCAYSQGQLEFQEERVLSSGAITGFVSTVECDVPGRAPVTVFRAPPQGPTFAKLPWLQCNPRPDSRGRMVADADGRPVPEVPLPARQRKRRRRPRRVRERCSTMQALAPKSVKPNPGSSVGTTAGNFNVARTQCKRRPEPFLSVIMTVSSMERCTWRLRGSEEE